MGGDGVVGERGHLGRGTGGVCGYRHGGDGGRGTGDGGRGTGDGGRGGVGEVGGVVGWDCGIS